MTTSPGALDLASSIDVVRSLPAGPWEAPPPGCSGSPGRPNDGLSGRGEQLVSPVEAVRRALDAVQDSDQVWKAWAHVDANGALGRAVENETWLRSGRPPRRLEAVTCGVKDIIDVAGMPCAAGFQPFAKRVPGVDAVVVARLVDSGAIVVGKTVTTQFAFSDPAPTVNPYDPTRTPGGSSSGSAVAVAVGHVPVAIGSQTSGSTIRPASYNGVVGFKPSQGRVPTTGVLPLAWSLDEVGLFARTVEECARVFSVVSGKTSTPDLDGTRPLRVGLVEDAFELAADQVSQAVHRLSRILVDSGTRVSPIRVGLLHEIAAAHRVIMTGEIAAVHAALYESQSEHYGTRMSQVVEEGLTLGARDYAQACRLRKDLVSAVAPLFDAVDVWLLPSVADVAPGRETTGDRSLQIAASLLGLPAINVPVGLSREGLPIGAQLVGRRGADEEVLGLAAALCRSPLYRDLETPEPGVLPRRSEGGP
jgi:aspartyl-tRNA(Asn)/glutamyl-tRNA(Gln) amidotransferase subunit A